MGTQGERLVTKAASRALSACAAALVAAATLLPWLHFVAGQQAAHACCESAVVTSACSPREPTRGEPSLAAATAGPAESCWICQALALLFHERITLACSAVTVLPPAPVLHRCHAPPAPVASPTVYPACRSHAPPAAA